MALEEIMNAVKKAISSEAKGEYGELIIEFKDLNHCQQQPDLTSAVFPQFSCDDADELSFARFLSADFTNKPFLLVSKIRPSSVSEVNVPQCESTPSSMKSFGSERMRIESSLKKDASEVWGSPLKCNFSAEDEFVSSMSMEASQLQVERKKPRPKHLGIPLKLARKIISGYNTYVNRDSTNLPPLVVLCDGEDRHNTAVLGVKPFQLPKESHTAKGFKMVTVAVNKNGGADPAKTLVKMGGGLSQSCHAVYQVNADNQKQVAVEIKWAGANCILETPPLEASTQVKASVQPGNMQSCQNLYQELQLLERVITALTTGQMEWISSSDKSAVPLTATVRALIETLQEEGTLGSLGNKGDGEAENWTFATALKSCSIPERKDYDFTDRLWKVMLDCMSTPDLLSSLRMVFKALGQGHLRPFVDRHNHTTVAQIVREAFSGRFSTPSLTGNMPFLFLAEMGAEKLRRDYIQIFVSQSLATSSSMEAFTASDQELIDKLQNLGKLHCVLEMMVMLGTSLRLRDETLGVIARQMLAYYTQNPVDPRHIFIFPVKTSEVRYIISFLPPSLWCLETTNEVLTVENVCLCESALHCLSLIQPLLHLQSDGSGNMEPVSEKQDNGEKLLKIGEGKSNYFLLHRKETVVVV